MSKKKTKPKIEIDLSMVESLAAQGLTNQQIADSLGISERTLQNRKKDNAEFAEAIKKGKAKGIAVVTNALMKKIKSGNVTAMICFLKTQGGWKENNQLEIEMKKEKKLPTLAELFGDETDPD
ncbi:LuxR family transcriptional regulator [Haemophilus influenzae]|uniref:LuxR C-terminal-related transcriptional regulator n=1 Tax=Haemophilus influenzae TaxID=727 RepID=UPI0009401F9C|nr:LuxR C-terminal-related transcriptional regulator [Haemophilus influenzae]OKQ02289.1 LuxR family transcriptional regulator [Haemophilus influenzae]